MRAINTAIEEAALFNDLMEKIAPQRAGGMFVLGENGRQYVPGENREQRRRREQAERVAAKRARKAARA